MKTASHVSMLKWLPCSRIIAGLRRIMLLLGAGLLLFACAPLAPPVDVTSPNSPTTAPAVAPTPTVALTNTPQPGKVFLIAPPGSDVEGIQTRLDELCIQSGLELIIQPDLQPAAPDPNTRVVVLLSVPPNLNELLAASPQTQFVVLSPTDLPPASNLSVIRLRPENQAFLAGFLSVLLSPDWRAAGLLPSDGTLGAGLSDAYINGGHYYCGVCAPGWPLGFSYPQVAQLPGSSDGAAWQSAAADFYENQAVEVYYLSAQAARPEVFAYLQGRDQYGRIILLVGEQAPPDEVRGQWAATVSFDVLGPMGQLWPNLLTGQGGTVVEAPLTLTDVNPGNLGEGRLNLAQDLMDDIAVGRIYPFTLPQE